MMQTQIPMSVWWCEAEEVPTGYFHFLMKEGVRLSNESRAGRHETRRLKESRSSDVSLKRAE